MGILTIKPKAFLEDNLKCLRFTQDLQDITHCALVKKSLFVLSPERFSRLLQYRKPPHLGGRLTSGSSVGGSLLSFKGLDVYLLLVLLGYS